MGSLLGLLWAPTLWVMVPLCALGGALVGKAIGSRAGARYWEAADAAQLNAQDFIARCMKGVTKKVCKLHLDVMMARARGGFRVFRNPAADTASVKTAETVVGKQSNPAVSLTKYTYEARGDPMIVVRDPHGRPVKAHHYFGPAVMLFFDETGGLKHIDFVGVCDFMGGQRQSRLADWVGEHARLYVQTGQWRYRDACGKHCAVVSACDWDSEKHAKWQPDVKWLEAFLGAKTFVLHAAQGSIIEGPQFGVVWSMVTAPELHQVDFDRSVANEWVNAILFVVSSAQQHGLKKRALELLYFAIAYGMAVTNTSQQLTRR